MALFYKNKNLPVAARDAPVAQVATIGHRLPASDSDRSISIHANRS